MNRLQRFEQSVRERCGARRRAMLTEHIWPAFEHTYGAQPEGLHPRPALLETLEELRGEGVLAFPKSGTLYDRGGDPALPQWIEWQALPEEESTTGFDHRLHSWHPRMAWVAGLPVLRDAQPLRIIDEFLKGDARRALVVPARERSLALFGDEKRLDSLRGSSWFAPDRLTLELLKCEKTSPPFLYRCPEGPALPDDGTILIIENHHTWHTFCRWNETSRRYVAVVYGAGTHFEASVFGLEDLLTSMKAGSVHYFGDLDPEGICIPTRANRRQCMRDLTPIQPAAEWYVALLLASEGKRHPWTGRSKFDMRLLEWLPASCHARVVKLFEEQLRLPQEYVGLEYLQRPLPG